MTTQYFTGFETGDGSECAATAGIFSFQNSVTRGAWSAYALRTNPTTTSSGSVTVQGVVATTGVSNASAVSVATGYWRFYFRADVLPAVNDEEFFMAGATAGGTKVYLRLRSDGKIAAYDVSTAIPGAVGTAVISTGVWYLIEVQVGTNPNAVVEWKVNGTVDFTTIVTLNTATNSGICKLGKINNRNGNTVDFYYDDLLMSDSGYPGDGRCTLLLPNANGNYQTATIGAGAGVNHYDKVNEVPPNGDTTYLVTDGTSSHAETEAMTNTSSAGISGTINSVKAMCIVKRDGASNGAIKQRRRSGATDNDLGLLGTTASYVLCSSFRDTDFATGIAWTLSGIDGVEIGVVEQSTNKSRLTFVGLAVDYTPSSGGHTVVMGQCTETDISQSQIHNKLKVTGLNTETDSLFLLQPQKTLAIGQNTETNFNQSIGRLKAHAIGFNTESDTAQSFIHTKRETFGLVNEIDTPFSFISLKRKSIALCTEVDVGLGIQASKTVHLTLSTETDSAFSVLSTHRYTLGLPTETDSVFSIVFFTPTPHNLGETIYGSLDTSTIYGSVSDPTIYGSVDTPIIYGDNTTPTITGSTDTPTIYGG